MIAAADQLSFDLTGDGGDEGPDPRPPDAVDDGLRAEQRSVVELAADYVVTAGAGSGKTRTLVALYSALLADPALTRSSEPIGPHRILCLTFTERAARELLRKVRERTEDPRWRRELETAPISTFHGWCADLLRRYPLEAGVDPRFSVLSDEAAEELLRTAALDSLRAGIERGDAPARRAVEILGLGAAAESLTDVVTRIRTAGWPSRRPIERFEERLAEAELRLGPLGDEVDVAAGRAVEAADAARMRTDGQRAALSRMKDALAAWRTERSTANARELEAVAKSAGSSWRFGSSNELRAALKDHAAAWTALALEIEHRFQLGIWPALAVTIRDAYRAERAARGALDYDDLLLRTRDLLRSHTEVLDEVRQKFRAVLVDEHQDTDPVQDEILRILVGDESISGRPTKGDPRWCVVGDAKQSIYGFRGATVAAFETLAREAAGRGARRGLVTNYRSRAELVAFHNAFFPSVLVEGPDADHPGYSEQVAFREPGGGPAVELLNPGDGRQGDEARDLEARALAARIAAACGGGPDAVRVWDGERREERWARPGDLVILLRRLTQVEPYRRALDLVGLESVVVGSGSFWTRQETFDVLNALDAALRPQDPIPLISFLRSPMAGLADDAIWRLVRGWDFATSLRRYIVATAAGVGLDGNQAGRFADALDVLDGIARRTDVVPPGDVVAWLVDRTGYAAVLDALPDRAQRRANVERLIGLADRAPSEGHVLLSQWAGAVRRRADRPPRDRDASLPEVGDRIRLLTIHQAKGLEFPIVAVADLGGRGRRGPGGIRFDPRLGVVAKVWGDFADKPLDTRAYALARQSARDREEAEEARLLYVAATRARDRLILSAGATGARWLTQVRAFAALPSHIGLLETAPLERWAERFAAAVGQAPPLADPGIAVRQPANAAFGEAAARELAAALGGQPSPPASIATAREAAADALTRGSRGHAALERLPLDLPLADVASWLAGPGALPSDEARALALYASREILPTLGSARDVARERPFRLHLPGGGVVVGAIDVMWRETDGSWWVGDYKFAGADGEAGARHEAQLAIYALAASAALGIDEVRGRLWYVDAGARHDLRWGKSELHSLESELDAVFSRLISHDPEPVDLAEDR